MIGWPPSALEAGVAVAALLLFGLLATLGYRWWRRRNARRKRLQQISAVAYELVQDVLVPDGNDGHVHVDFVLLTADGLLVVDLRDVPGMIFGSETMDEWTAMDGTQRRTFPNPLHPLYDRMAAVKLAAGKAPVEGRVVFLPTGSFPKGRPPRVTLLPALVEEFPLADRSQDPSPADAWAEEWAALKAVAQPSPLAQRR
jgi:hypothetical protein